MSIHSCLQQIHDGGTLSYESALALARDFDLIELCREADGLCRFFHASSFNLCSIINARSGRCSEDCRYCAQSARYPVAIDSYEQIETATALEQAKENDRAGVRRLSLVTAGRSVKSEQLEQLGELYAELGRETGLLFCASMGLLTREKAERLVAFGVRRYHCNLESCREYFPQVCTTHTWEEKVETIRIARAAGMDVCSGGIIGMGESLEQRLQLACELRELEVMSIPINILTPIVGTPFGELEPISFAEVLRTIAMFRFINPQAIIRLAGGRNQFGTEQYQFFAAGANGAIVGNYLTTAGNGLEQDLQAIGKMGFKF
ncbi:MAG: biotin synthase BioB [Proteobacteria bacterium]|nr:biotin synthase BioB [Desulfocapsa sp.]MBU3945719.1 biotin synthase BioB [Pseudomonadota bacterium]MCG2745042.1 biotin synthase BioB [Desulfobacteraceae bacterium]MBU3982839.1 biotin synthase BioB [Pseudomonadota bacterium]MBU4027437.1 biotin synthase BioB [Pseudomonadota bacterium]